MGLNLHIGGEPIRITENGTYTLYSNATSHSENCYYIKSSIDPNQWYVFEYRNKEDLFDEGIPETGMIIGRWCDTIPANYDGMLANPFFDFTNKAHQYWVFRPGSESDTVQGDIERAAFSAASGRDGFDMYSDPYPYLTDGTPDYTFVVYGIQENGESLTFSVEFGGDNVTATQLPKLSVCPNPTNGMFAIHSPLLDMNSEVQVFDAFGKMILKENLFSGQNEIDLTRFSPGVYVVKVMNENGQFSTAKVIKR